MESEWYEELGFLENPFDANRFFEIVGHYELKKELAYFIQSGSLAFVNGGSGEGKTSILKYLTDVWDGNGKVVYVNCKNGKKFLNINDIIMNGVGILGRIFNKKPKNMVLLLDNAEYLTKKNCEKIKSFYDHNYLKSVVFTGEDYEKVAFTQSMKQRLSKRQVCIEGIDENDAIRIIRSRINNSKIMNNEMIKEIFLRSRKNPKLFLKNCEKVCYSAFDEGKRKISFDIIEKVLPWKKEFVMESQIEEAIKEPILVSARGN